MADLFQPRRALDAHALLSGFTSLGDNCEFGLVQRRVGVEKIGLLRFAFSHNDELIQSMRDGFADLDPVRELRIEHPWNDEYITRFGTRGLWHHTFLKVGSIDPDRLRAQEAARIPFLRRRLMEDLARGETVFVRKSREHAPAQMLELHRAMLAHGPVTLLWVEEAGEDGQAGEVRRVADGLLRGHVDRFAPYGDAASVSTESWLTVCLHAARLLGLPVPTGAALTPARATPTARNDWVCGETLHTPPMLPDEAVFRHHTGRVADEIAAVLEQSPDVAAGQPCTASVWLRVPAGFRGRSLALVPLNCQALTVQPAILAERDRWQRLWVSAVMPQDGGLRFGLWVNAQPDDVFETTRWLIEPGERPGDYLLGDSV